MGPFNLEGVMIEMFAKAGEWILKGIKFLWRPKNRSFTLVIVVIAAISIVIIKTDFNFTFGTFSWVVDHVSAIDGSV